MIRVLQLNGNITEHSMRVLGRASLLPRQAHVQEERSKRKSFSAMCLNHFRVQKRLSFYAHPGIHCDTSMYLTDGYRYRCVRSEGNAGRYGMKWIGGVLVEFFESISGDQVEKVKRRQE